MEGILDAATDGIIATDETGTLLCFNRAAERMFGYAAREILGQSVLRLLAESEQATLGIELQGDAACGFSRFAGRRFETTARRRDGTLFPVELSVSEVRVRHLRLFAGILRDLTGRKQMEARLGQLAAAVEQSNDTILVTDREGRILYTNPACERTSGFRREEVLGKKPSLFKSGRHDEAFYRELWATLLRGDTWHGAFINRRKDGSLYEEEAVVSPVLDNRGEIVNFVAVKRDVSQRQAREAELAESRKLEAIGQIAAGIAHEINTPIQYVRDNTCFLKDAFAELTGALNAVRALEEAVRGGSPTAEELAKVQAELAKADLTYLAEEIPRAIQQSLEGLARATKIVQAMKEFAHPAREKTALNLNRAIESAVTLSANEWKYVAEVELDLDSDLPPVPCNPGEFQQVLLNLIVNAAHAIAEVVGDGGKRKGRITIHTRADGAFAEIPVQDTGCGIPPEIRERIFEPFFTTKTIGTGTGQGLSIAHSVIVKGHGGSLTFESEVGKGTCFIIRLPLEDPGEAGVPSHRGGK